MRLDRLEGDDAADPVRWAGERIDQLHAMGANGPLYVFIRDPPDPALADVLRGVTAVGRLHANVVAPAEAFGSNHHLGLVDRSGGGGAYLPLRGASAEAHDAGADAAGSWRRTLLLLTTAPRIFRRARVGVHVPLSPEMVRQLPGIFRLVAKLRDAELLLWFTPDGAEW